MSARLERYRAEWRSMNDAERWSLRFAVILLATMSLLAVLAAAGGNWLAFTAALVALGGAARGIIQVRVSATWRNLYESERDRPRREMWRQN